MISKKLAATLGTGTLGAGGAAGTAAWQFGLFDGFGFANEVAKVNQPKIDEIEDERAEEKQENSDSLPKNPNSKKEDSHTPQTGQKEVMQSGQSEEEGGGPKPESRNSVSDAKKSEEHAEIGSTKEEHESADSSGKGKGSKVKKTYFSDASGADKEAIDSNSYGLTWKKETSNNREVIIKATKDDTLKWQCTLQLVIVEVVSAGEEVKLNEQAKELMKAIKENENSREKFVENCSRSRLDSEKTEGNTSEIFLEAEKTENEWKFKDFKKLWQEEVVGIPRLIEEDKKAFEVVNESDWKIEETKSGKEGKIKISATLPNARGEWICSISGTYSSDLGFKTFKSEKLKNILTGVATKVPLEKKKYIIRNCAKNNKEIKGLIIQETDGDKWEFKEFRKITQSMYTNPTGT